MLIECNSAHVLSHTIFIIMESSIIQQVSPIHCKSSKHQGDKRLKLTSISNKLIMKSNFSHEEWIVITNQQSTSYREHTPYMKSIQRARIHYHKKDSFAGAQIKATNSNLLSDIKYLRATNFLWYRDSHKYYYAIIHLTLSIHEPFFRYRNLLHITKLRYSDNSQKY